MHENMSILKEDRKTFAYKVSYSRESVEKLKFRLIDERTIMIAKFIITLHLLYNLEKTTKNFTKL